MIEAAPGRGPATATMSDDASLLVHAGNGNRASVGLLYERHRSRAISVALSVMADPVEAEDVVQDVFIQLPRMARSYQPERGEPRTWLDRCVRNRAIDHLRRRARATSRVIPPGEGADLVAMRARSDLGVPHEEAEARVVFDLIGTLDVRQAHVLRLAFVEGWSHSAIAGLTGLPLGTVKTRIRTGLRALRDVMSEHDVTPVRPDPPLLGHRTGRLVD